MKLLVSPHAGDWCRVYWGSHGCRFERGHHGPHACECGGKPYHGRWTRFYGEDRTLFNAVTWHVLGWYYETRRRLQLRRLFRWAGKP